MALMEFVTVVWRQCPNMACSQTIVNNTGSNTFGCPYCNTVIQVATSPTAFTAALPLIIIYPPPHYIVATSPTAFTAVLPLI